uniref:Integrase catalytic domain-containing protein n=1 Tax=Romanomermis culicivorax TaxID=13658 RepID=A0A915J729_ROMCU
MVERFNQTLVAQLKKYTADDPDNWERYLPYAVFAYNATPHTATLSKEYFNRKARKHNLAVNDLVLLTNTCKANKIQPDFIGPFLITDASRVAENVVTIDSLDAPGRPQTATT